MTKLIVSEFNGAKTTELEIKEALELFSKVWNSKENIAKPVLSIKVDKLIHNGAIPIAWCRHDKLEVLPSVDDSIKRQIRLAVNPNERLYKLHEVI